MLTKHQSGFRPGDSIINQLLSITTTIFESFENYDETRAVFLDISKAFDKVWHDGLIFKLKCNGLAVPLVKCFNSYLSNRRQGVVLNGKEYERYRSRGSSRVCLGSVHLFSVHLPENVLSTMKLFADDSSLFTGVTDVSSTRSIIERDF